MSDLEAEHILHLLVACSSPLEVGPSKGGAHRVIPICGECFDGKLKGTVVPGSADWSAELGNGVVHLFARYLLQADDDEYIEIENEGIFSDSSARIKTQPRFFASNAGPHDWLNIDSYVGELASSTNSRYTVEINIYRMC